MRFISLAILALTIELSACAENKTEYSFPDSTQAMKKEAAERYVIEKQLWKQQGSLLDKPIKALNIELPTYPSEWAKLRNVPKFSVRVDFSVTEEGLITNIATPGDPNPDFAINCVEAVKRWRFEPPVSHGVPVTMRFNYVFVFNLDK